VLDRVFARIGYCAVLGAGVVVGSGDSLAGCRSATALTPQEAAGKHLYQLHCAHCHEDNDLSFKKMPPNLHHVFERATLPSGAPGSDAQVSRAVLEGKGMMPGFSGRFSGEQMADLLSYLHTGLR